jgi:hypothetical protein
MLGMVFLTYLHRSVLRAQQPATTPQPRSVTEPLENQVAKAFDRLRVEAKLPALKRITRQTELEQTTCMVALQGNVATFTDKRFPERQFYKTADLSGAAPELREIALINRRDYPRFSVAVWPYGSHEYLVGVYLFWSAWGEFFEDTFTDTIRYKNDWKRSIMPPCSELR